MSGPKSRFLEMCSGWGHERTKKSFSTANVSLHDVVYPLPYAHNWAKIGPIYWNAYRAVHRPPGGPGLPGATEGGLLAARKTVVSVVTYVLDPDIGLQKAKKRPFLGVLGHTFFGRLNGISWAC